MSSNGSVRFCVFDDKAPVYSTADTTSEVVTELNNGDEIILIQNVKTNGTTWLSIILPDGKKGYIAGNIKGIRIRNVTLAQENADIFDTPDIGSKITKTYKQGERFKITGVVKKDSIQWIKTENGFIPGGVKIKELSPSEKLTVLQEACNAKFSELTQPKAFGVVLTCPDCSSPLVEYVCPKCSTKQGKGTSPSAAAAINFIKIIGYPLRVTIFGGIIRVLNAGLNLDERQTRAKKSPLLSMAKKYQKMPETYDQAATLYYNWIISFSAFNCPNDFLHFLRCYRRLTTANIELREALYNAVLVTAVAGTSESVGNRMALIDAVYTGSETQKAVTKVYSDWRSIAGTSIYRIDSELAKIEKAHESGTDTRSSDLTLLPPAIFFRQILNSGIHNDETDELCNRAEKSKGYCEELIEELKMNDLSAYVNFADIVRSRSIPLATLLGKKLSADQKPPMSASESIFFSISVLSGAGGFCFIILGYTEPSADDISAHATDLLFHIGYVCLVLFVLSIAARLHFRKKAKSSFKQNDKYMRLAGALIGNS